MYKLTSDKYFSSTYTDTHTHTHDVCKMTVTTVMVDTRA